MRLLSDFDGVWTYPEEEGVAHGAALDAALVALVGEGDAQEVRACIAAARHAVRTEPTRWGWSVYGRLSAFADEDPFTEHGALLHYLHAHRDRDPVAERLCAAIDRSGETLEAFGLRAHVEGVQQVEARRGPGITVTAADAGRRMLERGIEIVVVSNSTTDKLQRWFSHARIPSRVHPARADHELRLRGSAGKFLLAPGHSETIEAGGLRVDIARPYYEAALREEAPDAIVGDVFSLDLALPLALKRREPAWRHVRLFWLLHTYSPARMQHELSKLPPGEIEPVPGGLSAVADLLLG